MSRTPCLALSLLALAGVAAAAPAVRPELAAMADTERAFSKLSVEKGIRESFLTYFADDAINFAPGPVNAKQAIRSRPAPAQPPPVTLEWTPMYGDISQAGDLGYLTGPFVFTDHGPRQQPPGHGAYFSIWKKQADGTYKVVLDLGTSTPEAVAPLTTGFTAAAPPAAAAKGEDEKSYGVLDHQALLRTEADLQHAARAKGEAGALLDRFADDARAYRSDVMPAIGKEAIKGLLPKGSGEVSWKADAAIAASSGDLGYTYGSYKRAAAGDAPAEQGYFLRVWRRGAGGKPQIVFQIDSPVPSRE